MLAAALRRARIHGVTTNRDQLVGVLADPAFLAGQVSTALLAEGTHGQLDRTSQQGGRRSPRRSPSPSTTGSRARSSRGSRSPGATSPRSRSAPRSPWQGVTSPRSWSGSAPATATSSTGPPCSRPAPAR